MRNPVRDTLKLHGDDMRGMRPPTLLPFLLPLSLCILYSVLSSAGVVGPFKRGFYANDETISHPKMDDTVPHSTVLNVAIFVVPVCIFASNFRRDKKLICTEVFIYFIGFVMSMTLTAITKDYGGRLRPDFIDRCKPDYSLTATPDSFITEDVCTGDEGAILQGRKSHPSGHAATSAFAGVYILLMWLRGVKRYRIHPAIATLGMAAIALYPLYVAASRVADYKHFPEDVFMGSVLGVLCSLHTAFYLNGWVRRNGVRGGSFSSPTTPYQSKNAKTPGTAVTPACTPIHTKEEKDTVTLEKDDLLKGSGEGNGSSRRRS